MTKKKHAKLIAKYGTEAEVKKELLANQKIRKPFYILAILVIILGLSLAAMKYYNII